MVALSALTAMIGCGNGLDDRAFPTGSTTVVASSDARALYTVDTDAGTVSRVDPETGAVTAIAVGREPTRLARAGDRVLVTLRGERGVAVLRESAGGLVLERVLPTGAEPYGIVANEAGTRAWVACSQSGEVSELDVETGAVLRSWQVPGEPRWLALHPGDRSLYVASALGGRLTRIDLRGTAVETIPLPQIRRIVDTGETVDLAPRITGDIAVTPEGFDLVAPVLYLDNTTPVGEPDPTQEFPSGGYASSGVGFSRFNPTVAVIPVRPSGAPAGAGEALLLAGFTDVRGTGEIEVVRSYPTSVTPTPDGMVLLVTLEASRTVVALSRPANAGNGSMGGGMAEPMPMADTGGGSFGGGAGEGEFDTRASVFVTTGMGPRGVAFLGEERAFVHHFLDRSVGELDFERVRADVRVEATEGFDLFETHRLGTGIELHAPALPPDVEAGRALFYSAIDDRMAVRGGGVSCSTCHMDGRNDGITWTFTDGVRQTPSLAGVVSETAPVTWTRAVPSVLDEAMITSQGRMGGHDLTPQTAEKIAAFVDWTREVDVPLKGSTAPEVLRGKAIFERSDVGCAECHAGTRFTDNAPHALLGLDAVNTPTLTGIAASAPYFHDGSAATLAEVVEQSSRNGMGDTSGLSAAEKADLEAYLRSL